MDTLLHIPPVAIPLEDHYSALKAEVSMNHGIVTLMPLITLKNCLPFTLSVEIEGKRGSMVKRLQKEIQAQAEISILDFSLEYQVKMMCKIGEFATNKIQLVPFNNEKKQNLFFDLKSGPIPLDIQRIASTNQSLKFLISAKLLIVQEIQENLNFLSVKENTLQISPLSVTGLHETEFVVFGDISTIKILPSHEGSEISKGVSLNQVGSYPVDVFDGEREWINLGVQVANILCGKLINIMKMLN